MIPASPQTYTRIKLGKPKNYQAMNFNGLIQPKIMFHKIWLVETLVVMNDLQLINKIFLLSVLMWSFLDNLSKQFGACWQ